MNVSELSGGLLDYWVARATGKGCWDWSDGAKVTYADWRKHHSLHTRFTSHSLEVFRPSTNWAHGGPIIESEGIDLEFHDEPVMGEQCKWWEAYYRDGDSCKLFTAETPLIAAMRAYVASKFGDEVADGEVA